MCTEQTELVLVHMYVTTKDDDFKLFGYDNLKVWLSRLLHLECIKRLYFIWLINKVVAKASRSQVNVRYKTKQIPDSGFWNPIFKGLVF